LGTNPEELSSRSAMNPRKTIGGVRAISLVGDDQERRGGSKKEWGSAPN